MRSVEEIESMFSDMDLETEEKRAQYLFSFSGECSTVNDKLVCYGTDTKTNGIKEQKDAELE